MSDENLNLTPPPCEKSCMAINAWNTQDTYTCEGYSSESACVEDAGETCAWKSKCEQGNCHTPDTLYVYLSTQNPTVLTMQMQPPGPDEGAGPITQYTDCQTATPELCGTYVSDNSISTANGIESFDSNSQQNCQGCTMYQTAQKCGAQFSIPPTAAPGATQQGGYQLVFDASTRPCECEPFIDLETGEKGAQDGSDPNDCCGDGTMWFAGGEGCLDPKSTTKNTMSQVRDACNAKDACTWSQNMKRCVPKACPRRATSKQCQKALRGQNPEKGLKQCAWIGEIGGHGHCIHGNCYDRCNERDCTSVVEDSRVSIHGGCVWVNDVENTDLPPNPSCAAANDLLRNQLQPGTSVNSGGVCMPLECTRRGKFQASDMKYTPPPDGKDVAQYEGALNAWHVELLDGAVALRPGRGKSGKREPTAATAVTGNGDGSGDGWLR